MYNSLGEYIERLDREGELLRISARVSSDCEIAEITERIAKSEGGGKAILFENTDTPFPVVTNIMGSDRRMALALGVDSLDLIGERIEALLGAALSPKSSIMEKLRMLPLLADVAKWFPRTVSSRGECQQVILRGDDARLSLLPILKCRSNDGGRFVTLPMVNTVDPDNGTRNVGMYRMQIFDERTTGMHWHRHKTGARHYDAYKARGERMPVSVAIGGDPIYTYCATAPMPDNMDEYLLAGFLRHKPVKLVKSITNNIYVPSDCDFVIEGYVDTAEALQTEGDFGDHTGFYSLTDLYPRLHVTAITHRRNAVYPATVVGIPPQEDAYISKATERIFLAPIRLAVQPEIGDLYMPVAGTSHNIAMVSICKRYHGQATKVAQSLWGAGQMMFNKYLVIAPDGTDLRSAEQVSALLRGCDIPSSVIRSEGIYDVLDHATATNGYGGKIALDLTLPAADKLPAALTAATLPEGVDSCRTGLVEQWSTLLYFAKPEANIDMDGLKRMHCNFVVLLDTAAAQLDAEELLWLAAANTDPRRDVRVCGASLLIDARSKSPHARTSSENMHINARTPKRWPNVVTSSSEVVQLVDSRWKEYGIGAKVESPSERYRPLAHSEGAEW